MKGYKLSLIAIGVLTLVSSAQAALKTDKVTLKANRIVEYNKLPTSANNFSEIFSQGMIYGRLKANIFYYDWENEDKAGNVKDNAVMGYGGSVIYKTAPFYGVSTTLGVYTSQNPAWFRPDAADVAYYKSGKDTFSRYDVAKKGDFGMTVLGQAYLQYNISKTSFYGGRQLFESIYTKSNDTKMIPNTFDGISMTSKDMPNTTIKLAYFTKQKLRDHSTTHDVIAFGGGSTNVQKWSENDDSAVNKNLTVDRIGDNNSLIIASVTNTSIKNLKTNVSFAIVPDVLSNAVLEAHYKIPFSNDWSIIPGIRYMQQFDNLDASYNVANLKGKHDGYKNPKSLDSNVLAMRVDIKKGAFLARLGYSQIADKADIVAPWRGFPTGGFTRAMAQYNWYANTKTYMLRAGYDFSKAGIIPGFSMMARYAIQDFDDKKAGVQADSNALQVEATQNISKNLEAKVRVGYVQVQDDIRDINGNLRNDISYGEYRFELNYFF